MQKTYLKYFLAANSCQGFVSEFNKCYSAERGFKAYIIKGGPGTGKSSFMKAVAQEAEKRGIDFELFPCSSDPNSLDGVLLPTLKSVILDGTSPHVVEPILPAVCETILNFGDFWDEEKFGDAKKVIELTRMNKALHKTASGYLKSAGELFSDNLSLITSVIDIKAAKSYALGLCKRHISIKNEGNGFEWVRFLSGVTPIGVLSFPETVSTEFENTVIIADEFGAVSNAVCETVREYCLKNGLEIITVKNALLPNTLTDAILIPSQSLAFVREYDSFILDSDARRIHMRRFLKETLPQASRERIKFNKKTAGRLLTAAGNTLKEAKAVHDLLEGEYIKAMDFDALNRFSADFRKKLFCN